MPATRSPSQQAASRLNGARSPGPITAAGKARSARNGTRHGLRGGPFTLLPGEDPEEFAALHAAVTADWRPRDAYEHRWVTELVTCMWRQDRLRALELATLAAAAAESPPGEATMKKLLTFAATAPASTRTSAAPCRPCASCATDLTHGSTNCRTARPNPGAPSRTSRMTRTICRRARANPAAGHTLHRRQPTSARTHRPRSAARPNPRPRLNRHQRRALAAMRAPAGGLSAAARPVATCPWSPPATAASGPASGRRSRRRRSSGSRRRAAR